MAYEDTGTGVPIVFVPGLTGTKDWFKYQFRGLRESYRIISYDVRTARNSVPYTLDLLVEDLSRFLLTLRLQSAVVAGHSFGAMITQRFATKFPQMVDATLLISAFTKLPDASDDTLLDWMSPGISPAKSTFTSLIKRVMRIRPHEVPDDAAPIKWLTAHSAQDLGETLDARIELVRSFDSTGWVERTEAPTLILAGEKDKEPFLAGAQDLYERIPDSELEVVEDAGHYCFYTHHDIVNNTIDDFLTRRVPSL